MVRILVQAQVTILWGFLDTLIKFISTRVLIGRIVEIFFFKNNNSQTHIIYDNPRPVYLPTPPLPSGMNGVAVAQYGLVLGERGATGSRKVSGCLRGPRDTIKTSKMMKT
jgi:hypothetical protein